MQTSDILIISVPTPVNDQLVCNYINYHTCHGCQLASQIKKERLVCVGKRKGVKGGRRKQLTDKRVVDSGNSRVEGMKGEKEVRKNRERPRV